MPEEKSLAGQGGTSIPARPASGNTDTLLESEVEELYVQLAYSGPVPLPGHVRELNNIEPGLGNRLVHDYLLQREHERQTENKGMELAHKNAELKFAYLRYSSTSLWCGLFAFFLLVGLAGFFAWMRSPYMAALFLAPPVIAVISVFVRGHGFSAGGNGKPGLE